MKNVMTVLMLAAVVMFAGSTATAANYSEDFATDPGWTYSGPYDPATIKWENHATHGGVVSEVYHRGTAAGDIDNSYYYTSDLDDVIGQTVSDDWNWTMSFDIYSDRGYKVWGYQGLSSTGFPASGNPASFIAFNPVYGSDSVCYMKFKYSAGGGSATSANLGGMTDDIWYTVEIAFHTDDDKLHARIIKKSDSSVVCTWTSAAITGDFSFDTFSSWDEASTSGGAPTRTAEMYLDNLSIVPEPATMVLLGLGGVGLLIRRRRRS